MRGYAPPSRRSDRQKVGESGAGIVKKMSDENEAEQTNEIGRVCHPRTWVQTDSYLGEPLAEDITHEYPHHWVFRRWEPKAGKTYDEAVLTGRHDHKPGGILWFLEPYIKQQRDWGGAFSWADIENEEIRDAKRYERERRPSWRATPEVNGECLVECRYCDALGSVYVTGEVRQLEN